MQLELKVTNEFLGPQVLRLFVIIHVKGLDQESLRFFEIVVYCETGHEIRVQVVINALGTAYFMFNWSCTLLFQFIKDNESICFGKGVQVRQINQRKRKIKPLFQC